MEIGNDAKTTRLTSHNILGVQAQQKLRKKALEHGDNWYHEMYSCMVENWLPWVIIGF